jgi:putative serine protease PepD
VSEQDNTQPAAFFEAPKPRRNSQFLFDEPVTVTPTSKAAPGKKRAALSVGAIIAASAVTAGAVGAGAGVAAYSLISQPAPVVVNNAESVNWVTGAAATASPSVVTVNVSSGSGGGNGSGEFLTSDGYILTNTHVVTLDGASASVSIEVKTFDGKVYKAKVVGTDPTNDLAVIKIDAPTEFTPIKFADSTKINVGDNVVAIGAPLGLAQTVTKGIVSALNRTIQVASAAAPTDGQNNDGFGGLQFYSGTGESINLSVIQTDAAINPGNSGGALVNERGELVGVNVAIASAGSTQAGSIGVGFAIPSNIAKRIANEIIKTGSATHALLGAMVSDATNSTDAASFSVGAKVEKVTPGGAAQKAGIQAGDVITKFNGTEIIGSSELTAAVRQLPAGATATVEYTRNGTSKTIQVKLGDASSLN